MRALYPVGLKYGYEFIYLFFSFHHQNLTSSIHPTLQKIIKIYPKTELIVLTDKTKAET